MTARQAGLLTVTLNNRRPAGRKLGPNRRLLIVTASSGCKPKRSESQLSVSGYLDSWARDSALVFKRLIEVIEVFVSGDYLSLRGLIDAYIFVEITI